MIPPCYQCAGESDAATSECVGSVQIGSGEALQDGSEKGRNVLLSMLEAWKCSEIHNAILIAITCLK